MILDFSRKNLTFIIEVSEGKEAFIKQLSHSNIPHKLEKKPRFSPLVELHTAGADQNDHHGTKYTGTYGSYALKYVSHTDCENELGRKLEFLLSDGRLNVTVHYQLYRDIDALRAWTVVENASDELIGLEYVSSFAYTGIDEGEGEPNDKLRVYIPHNTWYREVNWQEYAPHELGYYKNNNFSMKRIMASNTGTWSTKEYLPMGALYNSATDSTLMWQIEHNGSWHWEISDIANMMYIRLSGPTERENGWYKELIPGERFESVKACITFARDFDGALCEMTKYRRTIAKRNTADDAMPVIFNDYMNCLFADPTEEKELPMIDKAAALGAEYYVMDAGWYSDGYWWDTVGEWQPCARRFPHGIKYVFDYIRAKGMVPGIWLEPEVMGVNCQMAQEFDDECFFMRHGKRVIDHGRYIFDFRSQKVRDYVMGVIDRVVGEYGIGYIKIDYNVDGSLGTEVDADSFEDGLLGHNRAYLDFIDEVTAKYPELILENCSSGGMRMEYASLAHSHIQSTSDQTSYREYTHISAASATAVLPEQSAVWAYPKAVDDCDAVAVNMVNALLQRIHLSGQIANLTEDKLTLMREAITVYKQIREDIKTAIPFYPMGLPKYTDKQFCAALRCRDCVRIAVWNIGGADVTVNIPADGTYVRVLYPSASDCTVKKVDDGVDVHFPRANMAVIIEVK